MNGRDRSCDVCLGSDLAPYLDPGTCGRRLTRCSDCGLVSADPADGEGASLDTTERDPKVDRRRAAAVARLLGSGRVLEVGCGPGHFLAALDPARYEVVGVEPSARQAEEAARGVTQAGLRGGVVAGNLASAGLPAETFDLVALFGSLSCAASPRSTCAEVSRLLRPGGYVLIETPSLSSFTAMLLGTRWKPLRDPHAAWFFTAACLERLATASGLAPGSTWLPLPVGWPGPGTLVYVARKSSIPQRAASLSDLATQVGTIAPIGVSR